MKYFRSRVVFIIGIFIFCFIGTHTAFADVMPIGSVRSDTTLDPSTTYVVEGMNVVSAGVTLTVPANTHFIFTPGSYLRVDGALDVKGTPTKHVSIIGGAVPSYIPVLPLSNQNKKCYS